MLRIAGVVVAAIMLPAMHVVAEGLHFRVSPAPEWNSYFQTSNGWIGADVAYSVPLAKNKTAWFFGDTFVGQARDGKRFQPKMIHSSIAIQQFGQKPQFFYPVDKSHRPQSFIKSLNPTNYFWLDDGVRTSKGLYFFIQQIAWINNTAWGFKCAGTWLAFVENPDDPPAHWKISKRKLPFTTLNDGDNAVMGCEILQSGGYVYIYGFSNGTNDTAPKKQILARAPEANLDDLGSWEFFSRGQWVKNFRESTPIFSEAGAEGSVSWQPFLNKYVFVYTENIYGIILMREADSPEGPWSSPITLYHCPEMKISHNVFCYAGKGHPELSATNELLVSYASNSESLSEVINDTRLYLPRFIRVTFESP
jgi:hypothetical protein